MFRTSHYCSKLISTQNFLPVGMAFFFPEIRSTYLCKKAMSCLRRTFGIALCSFSHENNNLLFQMKILTRRYGIFVSKYDRLVYPKKLCLWCLEPLIIALSLFSHENNDLLFQTKKKNSSKIRPTCLRQKKKKKPTP